MNPIFAATCTTTSTGGILNSSNLPHTCATNSTVNTAFLVAFTIIGALAFLFLVIGGTRYVLARGNAEAVAKAKNQIQYSLIGLVIAGMAAAIVNFVVGRL